MIFAAITGKIAISLPTLLYLSFLFLGVGTLTVWLHGLTERLVSGRPVKGLFLSLWKDPNTYLSLACFALFGAGWFKSEQLDTGKRGKRFMIGVSGPIFCLILSVPSLLMIKLTSPIFLLYAFFKVLFRVSAYGAMFSLMPLVPFDGGNILLSLLPSKWQDGFVKSRDFSLILMTALVLTLFILEKIPTMAL